MGRALHRCPSACTCGACLTHHKRAFPKAGHLHCTLRSCRARQPTTTQGSGLRCTSGSCSDSPGTGLAPLGRALHRCHGAWTCRACLTNQKMALLKSGHLHWTLRSCRARQPTATQSTGVRCTSGAALTPQGLNQHLWGVRCIDATALARVTLALPSRRSPCPRPATCTRP